MTDLVPLRRALISVSDKSGLAELGAALVAHGVELVSTGGTARALREAGCAVTDVAQLTGLPEMMDGRVKTLHPGVHGGLLAVRDNPDHQEALRAHGFREIDLVVVNLYPFEAAVARGAERAEAIETIDVGGPAMIRAAAKNHAHVAVVVDPADYAALRDELDAQRGATGQALRRRLAQAAFALTAGYDAAVAAWMAGETGDAAPRRHALAGTRAETLRYGENPHQRAAFYRDGSDRPGVATARQLQGKALSYNNINDTDAAFELISELLPADGPACAIIKHANPCGVARAATLAAAYRHARDCDRSAAFGGIIALNQRLDADTAGAIREQFAEVVIAPGIDDAARDLLAAKGELRVLVTRGLANPGAPGSVLRQVSGGFLLQDRDCGRVSAADLRVVTARAPEAGELADMLFAWTVAKHVKSNAIVYARDGATVGIGAGQMSRVDATRIAARKAEDMAAALGLDAVPTTGAAVASDAFFPFADGLEAAAAAGARAVIQPGGSKRDAEVIAAADAAGLAMVFTGQRHFRH